MTKRLFMRKITITLMLLVFIAILVSQGMTKPNSNASQYVVIPEYRRHLSNIVISLNDKSSLMQHSNFIRSLPDYTSLHVLVHAGNVEAARKDLEKLSRLGNSRLISYVPSVNTDANLYAVFPEKDKLIQMGPLSQEQIPSGSIWAQDLFEPVRFSNNEQGILISDVHKWFVSASSLEGLDSTRAVPDNSYLGNLSESGFKVKRLPITFRGGNILFDELNGRKIAFVGGDVIRLTSTVWKSTKERTPSRNEIKMMIKDAFNVDQVVIAGEDISQPSLLFHLDQAMVVLASGVVGLTNIIEQPNVQDKDYAEIKEVVLFLDQLRKKLSRLGYQIVNIDTTIDNIRSFEYYANGIPYLNAETGRQHYYMPEFSGSTSADKRIMQENASRISKLDYKVSFVKTNANSINGGLHCLYNIVN